MRLPLRKTDTLVHIGPTVFGELWLSVLLALSWKPVAYTQAGRQMSATPHSNKVESLKKRIPNLLSSSC